MTSTGSRLSKTLATEFGVGLLYCVIKCSDNRVMMGIQFLTDEKGRKTAVQIDLRRHAAIWEDFHDGLVAESRRKEKSLPYGQYRTQRLKRTSSRA